MRHPFTTITEATCLRNGNTVRDHSVIANVAKPIGDSVELINLVCLRNKRINLERNVLRFLDK